MRPIPSELVVASKPWSISIGMPCVPMRFMLNPQANRPKLIFQKGDVRNRGYGDRREDRRIAKEGSLPACSGNRERQDRRQDRNARHRAGGEEEERHSHGAGRTSG